VLINEIFVITGPLLTKTSP